MCDGVHPNALVRELRKLGHGVISISENLLAGVEDEEVYKLTTKEKSILITRDFHFTNSLRFPPQDTSGIVYIRSGNLRAKEEVALITKRLNLHDLTTIRGKLVTLYRNGMKIR